MSGKVRIGVIGVGGIAGAHLAAYAKNPSVEIYAMCDINEQRLQARGEEYGVPECRRFADVYEMVRLPELDAVSVCTWNSAHAECTIAALNAGKHVLCEKPMAMNTEQAKAMKEAADKNGKVLQIGFVRRFGDDCAMLQDFSAKDFFGEFYYAKAVYRRRWGCPGSWFGEKARSGGGPLIDLGVHAIDLVRYLMGGHKPVSVYGAAFHKLGNKKHIKDTMAYRHPLSTPEDVFDVEDLATALIRFDNDSVLHIETSFTLNQENRDDFALELYGTKAGVKLGSEITMFTDINDYMANVKFTANTGAGDMFQHEIDHYIDCIMNGTPCRAPAEAGITLMKILDGIYESARTGHEVVLED